MTICFISRRRVDAWRDHRITFVVPAKPSALVETRVIYRGDNLDKLRKVPDGFEFTGDALFEIDRFRRKEGREIKPLTVREILDEEVSRA
jgi:hypothetical protein